MSQRKITRRHRAVLQRPRSNGFIEHAQSTSSPFTPQRERASDRGLTLIRGLSNRQNNWNGIPTADEAWRLAAMQVSGSN
jgi:hypothetical protein